ncbi:hypothetical protein IDH44_20450 [Paenibacillus sp. IB182496]|uniref:Uncharacterized protein n=1 Tax=Paenibacillus sabuli TaxID=2772509 RepID=A0A927BYC2_9BACL|nr:hypothetical protein [Paenibacillus sabuli]MBD2847568.1 hypothetical protein [Paenibacillus sabuli]
MTHTRQPRAARHIAASDRPPAATHSSTAAHPLLHLQQAAGNQALTRMLGEQAAADPPLQRARISYDSDDSSDEAEGKDDDPDFIVKEPSSKKRANPDANIKKNTYVKSVGSLSYETMGGAKHEESFDEKSLKRTTHTTGLKFQAPEFRNNAVRDKDDFKVHNPYGLSKGQNSLNQMVISHSTPSYLGMKAGKQFGNGSLTSPKFNSMIEAKEKDARDAMMDYTSTYDYLTETQYESLAENPRVDEIAKKMTNPKWDKDRIKTRLDNVLKRDKKAMRVKSEKRKMKSLTNKKERTISMKDPDLLAFIPRRAYDPEALRKYIEARGQDSEGSDAELEETKKKVKKKRKMQ